VKQPYRFASTSVIMALGSMVSLAAQALVGVAMLHFFTPQAAGGFAITAQVAFFWVSLSLAQGPLQFLADAHHPPRAALRAVLRSSLWRWLGLAPLVALAVWWSAMATPFTVMGWAALLALLQLAWYLAQPWTLRTASPLSAALVRAGPPVVALVLTVTAARAWPAESPHGLLLAAACGYAVGALWLRSARLEGRTTQPPQQHSPEPPATTAQADRRSTSLRLAHTAIDAIAGTALLLVWQRLHGLADASYLAMLLRLLGFIPAVVHTAWAQVLLARVETAQWRSLAVGLGAAATAALAGWVGFLVLDATSLATAWQGMRPYLLPLVLWQGSACISAALSHRPFQHAQERQYSWLAMALQALQLVVLVAPLWAPQGWSAEVHLWWLAGTSAIGLLVLSAWMLALPRR